MTAREIAKRRDETTRRRFKKEKKRRQKPEERDAASSAAALRSRALVASASAHRRRSRSFSYVSAASSAFGDARNDDLRLGDARETLRARSLASSRSARARRARSSRTRRRGSSGSASSRFVSTCTCGDGSRATEASGLAATRHGSPPRIDSARSSFLSSIASISAAREDQSERPSDAGCVAPRLGERRPLDRDAASIALDSARWCDASAAPGVACADGKGE